MININKKHDLEIAFSQDFSTPYFPILADIYMREGEIELSKKVCEIGLQYSPENSFGRFILAKIAIAEEKPAIAEKWLKQVINKNPGNFKALRMLIRLEVLLKRSIKTIESYINIILEKLPHDIECQNILDTLNSASSNNNKLKKNTQNNGIVENQQIAKKITDATKVITEKIDYKLESSMATLSMLNILKNQKHYHQALSVIHVLESKNIDPPRIAKEKREIKLLIKKSSSKV
tara:strand:- start:1737 stop:2438 length:702 start_codon:yes stop_codon:yes gene_type:complete